MLEPVRVQRITWWASLQ